MEHWTLTETGRHTFGGLETWGRLLDVHDGDTVTVAAPFLGDARVIHCSVRLCGVNAPEMTDRNPEGKAAAKRLARSIEPVAAVLARQAIADPEVLDDHLEILEARGFGDPALDELSREIVRLRLDADRLDSEALRRHLAARGFSALLIDIDRAATHAGAPFPNQGVTLAAARSQWSHAFEVLNRMAALEEALAAAKQDLAGPSGASVLMTLKAERDTLRRAIKTGQIWTPDEPI